MSDYKLNSRGKKGLYCNNCGKTGHYSKNCNDPTTSLGIINIKISPELIAEKNLVQHLIKKYHFEELNRIKNNYRQELSEEENLIFLV